MAVEVFEIYYGDMGLRPKQGFLAMVIEANSSEANDTFASSALHDPAAADSPTYGPYSML